MLPNSLQIQHIYKSNLELIFGDEKLLNIIETFEGLKLLEICLPNFHRPPKFNTSKIFSINSNYSA